MVWLLAGMRRELFFTGKLANQAHAIGERFQDGVAPAGGNEAGGALVHGLVGLREEAQMLAFGSDGVFLHGDAEEDVLAVLMLGHRKVMMLREFFGAVGLCILPIFHGAPPRSGGAIRVAA